MIPLFWRMLHLFNVFRENDGNEIRAQVLEEELHRMLGIKYVNDEHDCNVVSMNYLNTHDDNCYTIGAIHTINDESDYAYDMKRPKLGEAMFDEDDIFENIFAAINVCPKLADASLIMMVFLASQVLCKVVMMIACLLLTMIIFMKVDLERS